MGNKLKYIIWIMIVLFGLYQTGFASFEKNLYCEISKDKIIISLDSKNNHTCNVYIRYIESQMKNVYKDILVIQKYVDQKEDLWYWKPLKKDKVDLLGLLQNMRLNIMSHMQTFQLNLIDTSKNFFLDSINDYTNKISKSLKILLTLEDKSALRYISLLEQQLDVIEKISQAKTFDQLDLYIKRYVYLKQQIEWK